MDLDRFKTEVVSVANAAKSIIGTTQNQMHISELENMNNLLMNLVRFFGDDQNIQVLNRYQSKTGEVQDLTPLYNLCKSVIQMFEEIEPLLTKDIFNYMLHHQYKPGEEYSVNSPQNFISLKKKLQERHFFQMLSAFTILKHLEGHNKTLIIIGPNGSGKTSFANYMKRLDSHVKVIPASKPILAHGYIESLFRNTLKNYNDELYGGEFLNHDLLMKLIVGMCNEHDDVARKYMETKVKEKETTYEKVRGIFNSFFDVKLDNSSFSEKQMKAKKGDGDPFEFNKMSDGERAAFFYIATVIAAPEQSFIIIDEPENHLNPAVYNKIWDKLVETRRDCQFIFISHTMEFISARTNYELVKIRDFVYPDTFGFEFLGNALNDVDIQYVVEIVGSRKPLLFCEGTKSDYDYKIYERIFGSKYTVIPTGNCLSVENSVETCNKHATTYGIQSAIGIIDSDLKSIEEIDKLKQKKIYTLQCNEIEMLLVDEEVIKKSLQRVFQPIELFDSFKNQFFETMNVRKQHIVRRLTKTYIDMQLRNTIVDDRNNKTKDDIKLNLISIFDNLDVDKIWQEYEEKINTIIDNKNYKEALQYCCLEHGEIISGIGNRFIPDYQNIALGVLRSDEELLDHIKKTYLPQME